MRKAGGEKGNNGKGGKSSLVLYRQAKVSQSCQEITACSLSLNPGSREMSPGVSGEGKLFFDDSCLPLLCISEELEHFPAKQLMASPGEPQ